MVHVIDAERTQILIFPTHAIQTRINHETGSSGTIYGGLNVGGDATLSHRPKWIKEIYVCSSPLLRFIVSTSGSFYI